MYRSHHPTFCTYMEDNIHRGLDCNTFAYACLYWWRRNFNAVILQYCNNTRYVYAIFIGGHSLNVTMLHQTFKASFLWIPIHETNFLCSLNSKRIIFTFGSLAITRNSTHTYMEGSSYRLNNNNIK
jgi:hypothetical protein